MTKPGERFAQVGADAAFDERRLKVPQVETLGDPAQKGSQRQLAGRVDIGDGDRTTPLSPVLVEVAAHSGPNGTQTLFQE